MKNGIIGQIGLIGIGLAANLWGADMGVHNVVWDSPSKNEHGSMPIGNGDLAANVWVEPSGDLVFYISKSDAWSGNGRLLKLGRVRVRLTPPLYTNGVSFRQELDTETGTIKIESTAADKHKSDTISVQFWIDANRPVIHLDINSTHPVKATAALEVWRTARRELKGQEAHSACGIKGKDPIFVEPDTVLPARENTIRWYHRNNKSCYEVTLKNQHLGSLLDKYQDPLINLTFGGLISGDGMVTSDNQTLVTKNAAKQIHIKVYVCAAQTDTPEEWVNNLAEIRTNADRVSLKQAYKSHTQYWRDFWNRSWIEVSENRSETLRNAIVPDNAYPVCVGMDPQRGNHFVGRIESVNLVSRPLSAKTIQQWAQQPRDKVYKSDDTYFSGAVTSGSKLDHSENWQFNNGLTVSAWVKPGKLPSGGGRIVDKCKPKTADGFVLDTYPGNSLRLITKAGTLTAKNVLPVGVWSHVAGTADPQTGKLTLYLNGKPVAQSSDAPAGDAEIVSRAYKLQRWITACAGRGKYPIKFNGSLFTVAGSDKGNWDADYRRWGGNYWFQNTRLAYWPMLYSGDFDMMQPLWKMYRDALPLLKDRTKIYYKHDGIFCSETMYFWGTYNNENFGWGNKSVHTVNSYIRYYWDSGNELSMMMLDYYDMTQDAAFAKDTLLPIADNVVLFYDQHYKRNAQGKVHFSPAMSLETWHKAEDPLPIIIGLKTVLSRLLELPHILTTKEQRRRWSRFLAELPEVPIGVKGNTKWIKPAAKYSKLANSENPELYAVFPYRAYTMHKPDYEMALETWKRRRVKRTGGWTQDPIQAALLGLTDQAKNYVVKNATTKDRGSRFPAFWGPNFDWIPDQDHGSVLMIALQRMLMQCEGDKIYLLPAWPKDWNADFKLHAPYNTVVEGRVENGKVLDLKVTPAERRKDIADFVRSNE